MSEYGRALIAKVSGSGRTIAVRHRFPVDWPVCIESRHRAAFAGRDKISEAAVRRDVAPFGVTFQPNDCLSRARTGAADPDWKFEVRSSTPRSSRSALTEIDITRATGRLASGFPSHGSLQN